MKLPAKCRLKINAVQKPRVASSLSAKQQRGFTLLEALIALVIFGIIMFAISNMLTTTLYAQSNMQTRQEEAGAVRAVFSSLQRDLSAAYASGNNTNTAFIAGGGQGSASVGGRQSSSSSLITLTTFDNRIQIDDMPGDSSGTEASGGASGTNGTPQSDTALVRYDLDPQTNRLTRHSTSVPSLSALTQAQPGLQDVLADNVRSVTLRFWDSTQNNWRTDWDYETQAPTPPTSGAASTAGTSTGGSGAAGGVGSAAAAPVQPPSSTATGSGDQTLPGSVEITLELMRKDGTIATFTTSVPILAPQPATATPAPTTPPAGGAGAGTGGTTGNASGGTTGTSPTGG